MLILRSSFQKKEYIYIYALIQFNVLSPQVRVVGVGSKQWGHVAMVAN